MSSLASAKYYQNHHEERVAQNAQYRAENHERILARRRELRELHKDEANKKQREQRRVDRQLMKGKPSIYTGVKQRGSVVVYDEKCSLPYLITERELRENRKHYARLPGLIVIDNNKVVINTTNKPILDNMGTVQLELL